MPITDFTKMAVRPGDIVDRIRKLQLAMAKEPSGGELLRIVREHGRRKPKVVYVDKHKREVLTTSSAPRSPATERPNLVEAIRRTSANSRSRSRLVK